MTATDELTQTILYPGRARAARLPEPSFCLLQLFDPVGTLIAHRHAKQGVNFDRYIIATYILSEPRGAIRSGIVTF
jgi:hypothetical protein